MSLKVVSGVARLIGFIMSPLLTAAAAAAELERGQLSAAPWSDGPAALHTPDVRRGADAGEWRHLPVR